MAPTFEKRKELSLNWILLTSYSFSPGIDFLACQAWWQMMQNKFQFILKIDNDQRAFSYRDAGILNRLDS